jgi:hypothetical protein
MSYTQFASLILSLLGLFVGAIIWYGYTHMEKYNLWVQKCNMAGGMVVNARDAPSFCLDRKVIIKVDPATR